MTSSEDIVSVLHHVEDVEQVSLVLQGWTLLQLPNQGCKVCVALRVLRQVQLSRSVRLSRVTGVIRSLRQKSLKNNLQFLPLAA